MIRTAAALDAETRAMLAVSVQRGGHAWSEIERKLDEGRALLWVAPTGCVMTEVDGENVCTILVGGGRDARSWVRQMEAMIAAHPAHRDVNTYRIVGRRGWHRLFPHWDYAGEHDGCTVLERAA